MCVLTSLFVLKLKRRARLRRDLLEIQSIVSMEEQIEKEGHRCLDIIQEHLDDVATSTRLGSAVGRCAMMSKREREWGVGSSSASSTSSSGSGPLGQRISAKKKVAWQPGFLLR